jgi:hypothetical protein
MLVCGEYTPSAHTSYYGVWGSDEALYASPAPTGSTELERPV